MPRAPKATKAVDHKEGAMALLEKEAIRFAEALDDYDHVSVRDIGGNCHSYWVVVRDHRFELDYEISSHCDWDFVGALVGHRQCLSLAPRKEVA